MRDTNPIEYDDTLAGLAPALTTAEAPDCELVDLALEQLDQVGGGAYIYQW